MSPADFVPREYTTPDGHLRVRRTGVLWYADVLSPAGRWCPVVKHETTHEGAMLRCLEALDLLDAEHDEPEPRNELEW